MNEVVCRGIEATASRKQEGASACGRASKRGSACHHADIGQGQGALAQVTERLAGVIQGVRRNTQGRNHPMQNPDYVAERRTKGQVFGVIGEAKVLRSISAKSNATRRMGSVSKRQQTARKERHSRDYAGWYA